jgi:hypothetical protein
MKWTAARQKVAYALAEGYSRAEAAEHAGVSERYVYQCLAIEDFSREVDRLSLMVGIATRAERLRLAQRVIRQKVTEEGELMTDKDLLDWLKFAQGETDGIKLDLTSLLFAAESQDAAPLAGRGSDGVDPPPGDGAGGA